MIGYITAEGHTVGFITPTAEILFAPAIQSVHTDRPVLAGRPEPITVFQLRATGLPEEPLRTLDPSPGNLLIDKIGARKMASELLCCALLPAPHRSPTTVKAAESAPGRSQTCSTGPTRGQTVTLNVLAVNSRGEGLYRRLGFVQADRHGSPPEVRITMACPR